MIDKIELVGILKRSLIEEEKAIPVYMKHLKTAVTWTDISKEDVERIRTTMSVLLEESEGHKRTVQFLLDTIEGGDKDAY